MKLNRTGSNWTELERNKINENWRIIESNYNDVVDKVSEEAFDKVVNSAKLNWKEPVDKYADLPSGASEGDTRMVRDSGKVYRFNGEVWQEIQQIDAGPVNELDDRLTTQLAQTHQHISEISVNLKTYNELANGDDWTNALQQAISDYDSLTLLLPNGEYIIDTLPTKNNVRYLGAENTVVKLKNTIDINTLKNVEIKGIKFKPQNRPSEPIKSYVDILNSKNINIEKCVFDGDDSYFTSGIRFTGSKNVSVVNCDIKNLRSNKGVDLVGCEDGLVEGNRVMNTGRAGISMPHSNKRIKVIDNFLSNTMINFSTATDGAIDLYGIASEGVPNKHIEIINNHIEKTGAVDSLGTGIRLKDSHHVTIKGNTIIGSLHMVRYIYIDKRGGYNSENIFIEENSFEVTPGTQYTVIIDINDTIVNSRFKNNTFYGDAPSVNGRIFFVRGRAENMVFSDNTIDLKGRGRIIEFRESDTPHKNVKIENNIMKHGGQIIFNDIYYFNLRNNVIDTSTYEYSTGSVTDCNYYFVTGNTFITSTTALSYSGGGAGGNYYRDENIIHSTA